MDKQKESTVSCEGCIHYGACSAWNRGVSLSATATRCINFERLRDSAVYYIGAKEAVKKFAEILKSHYPHTPSVCVTIDKVAKGITEGI